MNIPITDLALLETSRVQREHFDAPAEYAKAMVEFRKLQTEAHELENWRDKDTIVMWSIPCGWLDDEISDAREAAVQAWLRARKFRRMMRTERR